MGQYSTYIFFSEPFQFKLLLRRAGSRADWHGTGSLGIPNGRQADWQASGQAVRVSCAAALIYTA